MGLFQDYIRGAAMARNPALLQRRLQTMDAQAMKGTIDTMYGQQELAQETAPYPMGEGEMMEGEAPIQGLMDITQEAQEGSGLLGSAASDAERRYLEAQKVLGMSGNREGLGQQSALLKSMQNSVMGAQNGRAPTTFEMGAGSGKKQRAYFDEEGNVTPIGDPYRAHAPQAMTSYAQKVRDLQSDDPNVVASAKTAMRSQWDDVGTGKRNRVTGEFVPKDIAGAEISKAWGQNIGSRIASYDSDQKTARDASGTAKVLSKKLDALFDKTTDWGATGLTGTALSKIWGTDASDWASMKDSIVSNVALDKLLEMKASSPTGASGFGALSQRELALLENNIASLEQTQSPKQAKDNIRYIQDYLKRLQVTLKRDQVERERWYKKNTKGRQTDPIYSRDATEPATTGDSAPNGIKWAD